MTFSRRIIVAAALLVCAGAAPSLYMLLADRVAQPASTAETAPAAPENNPNAPAQAALGEDADSRRTTDEPLDRNPGGMVALRGTIVVEDASGGLHASEFGTLIVRPRRGSDERRIVDVADGAWSAPASDVEWIAERAVLGGRAAVVTNGEREEEQSSTAPIRLHAQWTRSFNIHAVDAESGEELKGVSAVWDKTNGDVGAFDRDEPPIVARDASPESELESRLDSPFRMERRAEESAISYLLLFAEGHSRRRVALHDFSPDEPRVALRRYSPLEVRFRPHMPADGELIIFSRTGSSSGRPVFSVETCSKDTAHLLALPGEYACVLKERTGRKRTYAEAAAHVEAGNDGVVNIDWLEFDECATASMAGILILPREWIAQRPTLHLRARKLPHGESRAISVDFDSMVPEGDDRFRWTAGDVPCGEYEASVLFENTIIVVPPEGVADARIEVGPPIMTMIRVVDAVTRAPIRNARAHATGWQAFTKESSGLARDPSGSMPAGLLVLRLPRGRHEVAVEAPEHGSKTIIIDAQSDAQVEDAALPPLAGVHLDYVFETEPAAFPAQHDVVAVGHTGSAWFEGPDDVRVSEPGEYLIVFRRIKGFLRPSPIEVNIPEATIVEVQVQLEPSR